MEFNSPSFDSFSFSQKQLLYRGLVALVNSKSGNGVCNNDQGHMAYAIGRDGTYDYEQWGDSPEHNQLFIMMHALSLDLSEAEIDGSAELSEYVFAWCDFCNLVYSAYQRGKDKG
jgi:hypothetical protein